MRLDGHIHTGFDRASYIVDPERNRASLTEGLKKAGLCGGSVISVNPLAFRDWSAEQRLRDVMDTCAGEEYLFPVYWIDPLESDAEAQADLAVKAGVKGFKMACSQYAPYDPRCLKLLEHIAALDKPVLFHSGILWDGIASANYNKPSNFEALIEIPRLRFCLAHVSWPWYDECIAVYGKFQNAYYMNPSASCEMFIDVTPGTPRLYREEVFTHLLVWSEYELRYNLIFGTDSNTSRYNSAWATEWQQRDDALYDKLIGRDVEDFKEHVYSKNLLRFFGLSGEQRVNRIPMVGE